MNVIDRFITDDDALDDCKDTVETLFISYTKTEDFLSLTPEARNTMVNNVVNLICLIRNILKINKISPPVIDCTECSGKVA